jgi:hypothetical protein
MIKSDNTEIIESHTQYRVAEKSPYTDQYQRSFFPIQQCRSSWWSLIKPCPERSHHLGYGLSRVLSLVHPHTCHQALLLVSVIRKTQLNSVVAANHVCTILHTVANLPFYTVLRAALCSVNLY